MELSATAKVILGMLAARPRSGYEIKTLVDSSARFFWAASYGQIYPELKRLEDAGLITGADASQGARQRTVYKLTAKGKRAAREWIERAAGGLRASRRGAAGALLRGLDRAAPRGCRDRARARREGGRTAAELRAVEEPIEEKRGRGPEFSPDQGSLTVLRYGIEMNEWAAEWFERAAEDLKGTAGEQLEKPEGVGDVQRTRIAGTEARKARRHPRRRSSSRSPGALGGAVADRLDPYGADDPPPRA